MHAKLLQSCTTLCDPVDCSPPGSSDHEILQAWILEWVAVPSSWRSSRPRDQTCVSCVSCIAGRFFTSGATWEAQQCMLKRILLFATCKFFCCSVAKSCLTLCDPMNCSMLSFPVLHSLSWVCSNSCPLSWWCHPIISPTVAPFTSCPQSFPASGFFQWVNSKGCFFWIPWEKELIY